MHGERWLHRCENTTSDWNLWIVVDPASIATGSVTLTLYDVPADFSTGITAGGSAVTATMGTPGQNGLLTFSGTGGQRVSLRGTNALANHVLGCDLNVSINSPAPGVLVPTTCMEGGGYVDVVTLQGTTLKPVQFGPADAALSALMQRYWTNFVTTGDPNGPGLPPWPAFSEPARAYVQFTGDEPVVKEGLRRAQCDLYAENAKRLSRTQ